MEIMTSWKREGLEQGLEQGRREGEIALATRLLERKIGELPASVKQEISQLKLERLEELGEALLDFSSLAELESWLQAHS